VLRTFPREFRGRKRGCPGRCRRLRDAFESDRCVRCAVVSWLCLENGEMHRLDCPGRCLILYEWQERVVLGRPALRLSAARLSVYLLNGQSWSKDNRRFFWCSLFYIFRLLPSSFSTYESTPSASISCSIHSTSNPTKLFNPQSSTRPRSRSTLPVHTHPSRRRAVASHRCPSSRNRNAHYFIICLLLFLKRSSKSFPNLGVLRYRDIRLWRWRTRWRT